MPRIKISKVAKDLNVALPTVVEFLRSKDISVDDNPNARIEEEVVAILESHFKSDKDIKDKSQKLSTDRARDREKAKPAQRQPEEITLVSEINKPKILGKIELDRHGNPLRPKPAPEPVAKPAEEPVEKPAETKVAEELPSPEAPKPAPAPAAAPAQPKQEVAEPAPAQPAAEQPKPAPAPVAAEKPAPEKPATPAVKETPAAAPAAANPAEPKDEKEEIFTVGLPSGGPSINVVGKIDLSAINQSTRPKKKSKEERRNERLAKSNANGGEAGNGDRKKRKRIGGKEKIDIEKTSNQPGQNNGGRDRGGKGGKNSDRNRRGGVPGHTEVNEEDVQKQVKEVLARLTAKDKGQKRGVKWRKEKREAIAEREREAAELEAAESRVLKLTEFVTANDLASMMDVPINKVIGTCMNLGVMVSINQRLDAETINIVAEEFGYKTEFVSAEVVEAIAQEDDDEKDLVSRPPIVTVMGHVDHGKTSLLDHIRKANVIAGEAGGITQHIGAYNVKLESGRHITFLDTPGHEAFTAMRARGAQVTDIAIIIIAADDDIMPQTKEAINHAVAANVPIVFAINKIDKPHANPDKIKESLAAMNFLVEEWGGKYQSQDISAKKGLGVQELLEKVLLEADMLELKANPNRKALGTVIESSLDKGRGYVATVLVSNGTLRQGDVVLAGTNFGRVKALFNERGQRIQEVGPAQAATLLGFNGAPQAGDQFHVMGTEQEAREIATKREQLQREQDLRTHKMLTLDEVGRRIKLGSFKEMNIIVKGDVDGSVEALSDSFIKLSTETIAVNVIHKGVGQISENDVTLAAASQAVIVGFQVRPSQSARKLAEKEGVDIRQYSVIYDAIEEVKEAMEGMLEPVMKEEMTATIEVRQVYHISKVGFVAGAYVIDGKVKRSDKARLIRDGIVIFTGEINALKRFKDDVKEVTTNFECGISLTNCNDIKEGDIIETYQEIEVKQKL